MLVGHTKYFEIYGKFSKKYNFQINPFENPVKRAGPQLFALTERATETTKGKAKNQGENVYLMMTHSFRVGQKVKLHTLSHTPREKNG